MSIPTTCPSCIDEVILYLDGFAQSHNAKFIKKLKEQIFCDWTEGGGLIAV